MAKQRVIWTTEEESKITEWLGCTDEDGKHPNLSRWNKGKRKEATAKLIEATGLTHDAAKVGHKVESMFVNYRRCKDKINTTGWGALAADDAIKEGEPTTVRGKHSFFIFSKCR